MTTVAMIFGMLPLALAIGEGAEQRAPMARAVIGGLITSTLLTLLVVPVMSTLLEDVVAAVRGMPQMLRGKPSLPDSGEPRHARGFLITEAERKRGASEESPSFPSRAQIQAADLLPRERLSQVETYGRRPGTAGLSDC